MSNRLVSHTDLIPTSSLTVPHMQASESSFKTVSRTSPHWSRLSILQVPRWVVLKCFVAAHTLCSPHLSILPPSLSLFSTSIRCFALTPHTRHIVHCVSPLYHLYVKHAV